MDPALRLSAALTLGLLGIAAISPRSAKAQDTSTAIPCAEAPLVAPFATKQECRHRADDNGRFGNCLFTRWSITGGDTSHGYMLFLYRNEFPNCWVRLPDDMAAFLRGNDPVTSKNGQDFTAVRQVSGASVSIFRVTYNGQPIQCFSFYKPGYAHGGGYANNLTGHVCNRDGAPVTDAELQQVVATIQVR